MAETTRASVVHACRSTFGEPTLLIQGPGRVNLIGEHTDYNMGFVLPAAVDKVIWQAVRVRSDDRCRFHSVDLDATFETTLGAIARSQVHWANYLMGVISEVISDGHSLRGVECAFGGNLPIGSGMSSSAALECGFAFALNDLFDLGYDRLALAKLGQRAENRFVGLNSGIMDQVASVLGREGHLIRLDCRDLSFEYVPFDRADVRVVLCDTQIRRALAESEYNVRRAQCEAGVEILARHHPHVTSLRDVTEQMLMECRSELDPVVLRRCTYVVQENQRVIDGCGALSTGDLKTFGALMNASHLGLSSDYQVSCQALDVLAHTAQSVPGVLGSRMMGAGFGGCTISLVEESALARFQESMAAVFRSALMREPVIHVCRLTGGTRVLN